MKIIRTSLFQFVCAAWLTSMSHCVLIAQTTLVKPSLPDAPPPRLIAQAIAQQGAPAPRKDLAAANDQTTDSYPRLTRTEAEQMKTRFALALLGICVLSGCHGYGHLYPVQGPLASMSPVPSYTFSITYPGSPKYDHDQSGEV